MLEKKYAEMTTEEQLRARLGNTEIDMRLVEPDLVQKIRAFQEEIARMSKENRSLRLDNNRLVNEKRAAGKEAQPASSSSSSSSSSDSSGSSSDSDSSSESEAEVDTVEKETWTMSRIRMDQGLKGEESWATRDDTGYESERSTLSDRVTSSSRS